MELTTIQIHVTMLAIEHAMLTAAPSLPPWHMHDLSEARTILAAEYDRRYKEAAEPSIYY